jgi:ABC-2 type transport system permease protein
VSFLNLAVVGLLMSTFTTRFIFPMVSLEGQRFWLIGLFPVRRETVLWSKFWFAAAGTILPCSALILLSDVMLVVDDFVIASHQLTCTILCFGLAGIAVGLGARLPNYREQSPSRIAAGFGGTLCLVFSTLYIVAVVLLTAVPTHFYLAERITNANYVRPAESAIHFWLKVWLWSGTGGSILLGILATVIPLWLGFRTFRRAEF